MHIQMCLTGLGAVSRKDHATHPLLSSDSPCERLEARLWSMSGEGRTMLKVNTEDQHLPHAHSGMRGLCSGWNIYS